MDDDGDADGENARPTSAAAAAAAARALGLPVSAAWADAALAAKQQSAGAGDARAALLAAFLTADLNACGDGVGTLPADLAAWNGRALEGRFVLQVDEVVNAAAPAKQRYDHAPHPRLLKLLLTDGSRQAVAFEFEPCPPLGGGTHPDKWVSPGAKLVLADPPVCGGMLALRPGHVGVLGGGVARLGAARDRALAAWRAPPNGGPAAPHAAGVADVIVVDDSDSSEGEEPAPPATAAAAAAAAEDGEVGAPPHSPPAAAPFPPTGPPPPAWPAARRPPPPPGGRALLPAPPARIARAAGTLRFMGPDGGPLPGGLAMDVVLRVGGGGGGEADEEVTAAVDAAVLEAALRGEVAGGGGGGGGAPTSAEGAATTASPPPGGASTPAELIALYATSGPEAAVARIRAVRAALVGFGGAGCVIGVEADEGGVRVVGLWRREGGG